MTDTENLIEKNTAPGNTPPPELDRNMTAERADADGFVWYDVTAAPVDLYGFYRGDADTPFCRLPEDVARATNPGVLRNRVHTAGGRVRFRTDSRRVAIRAAMPYITRFAHMPLTGSSAFDMYVDSEMGSKYRHTFKPDVDYTDGYTSVADLKTAEDRFLTINFPLYSPVSKLEIGINAGSALGHGAKYTDALPVVFYGSSITQGACASRPGLCYEAHISRRLNIDHINLGFSGNARAELPIVEYMAGIPMSVFVSDYDHNAPHAEYLRSTHCRMYRIIREKNPDIPYIMVSRPNFDWDYNASIARRAVVEDTFRFARENGDRNVYYIDGEGLYRGLEEDSCSVDGLHPNDLGFMKMADEIGRLLRRIMRDGLKK